MKTNHVPVTDRLQARIDKLWHKISYGDYWTTKRFYPKCKHCGITIISSNMLDGAHYHGCFVSGVVKEIAYYEKLLSENKAAQ